VAAGADVRRGEVVLARYRVEGGGPVRDGEERVVAVTSAGPVVEADLLAGDAARLLWPEAPLRRWIPNGVERAVAAARLVALVWGEGKLEAPVPRYARGADARPRRS
jgi:hypothetical protein